MAWIKTIEPDAAEGALKREYDAAIKRAGKVFNVVKIQGLRPKVLRASMGLYGAIMYGPSALTRAEREFLAVVTSHENACHY